MTVTEVETGLGFTETLSQDEWNETGGGGALRHGIYTQVLEYVRDSNQRYHRIPMDRGPFAGKKASSVSTALKGARDGKNAPKGVDKIQISSQGANEKKGTKGVVFLENESVAPESE
jgi:hypothetical protein